MVHFNIRSRYMGEISGMKAAFQGNMDMLVKLLLDNLAEAEELNGEIYWCISSYYVLCASVQCA